MIRFAEIDLNSIFDPIPTVGWADLQEGLCLLLLVELPSEHVKKQQQQ